jgi:hypothetical protein
VPLSTNPHPCLYTFNKAVHKSSYNSIVNTISVLGNIQKVSSLLFT